MISLTQLEYVVAVDTHRHFARAAKACFVTQPTLSAQLGKLEDDLNVLVFDRSIQPIVPTAEGEQIIAQARVVLAEFKKINAIASGAISQVSGPFSIGIIPTVAPYLVPLFLEHLSTSYPKLRLDIKEMTTAQIVEALTNEMIDAGILAVPVENVSYEVIILYGEPFYLYVHYNHPLASKKNIRADDIDGKDMWLLEEGHCLRGQILQACKLRGQKLALSNVTFNSGSMETLKHLVQRGLGYTFVPHLAAGDASVEDGLVNIVEFNAPAPSREVGLMFRRTQLKRPAIDAVVASIKKNLPKSLLKIQGLGQIMAVKS